jgi:hypothetical protein
MSTQSEKPQARSDESEPIDAPPATIRWRSWPAAEHLRRTGLVALALLTATVVVRWSTGRTILALLALAALLAALWRYFLPVQFELDDHGVDHWALGLRRHVPWSAIARYEVCRTGVLLVPTSDHSAMSALAGLFLPFAENDEAVLRRLRYYIGPAEATRPSTEGSTSRLS